MEIKSHGGFCRGGPELKVIHGFTLSSFISISLFLSVILLDSLTHTLSLSLSLSKVLLWVFYSVTGQVNILLLHICLSGVFAILFQINLCIVYTQDLFLYTYTNNYYLCTCVRVCICTCVHVLMQCMLMCVRVCTYIYIYKNKVYESNDQFIIYCNLPLVWGNVFTYDHFLLYRQ